MRVELLDHGYIALIDHHGSDEGIIETARMSTGKGFLGWDAGVCPVCIGGDESKKSCTACESKGTHRGDKKLLEYLYVNKHSTPSEFAGVTFEIQAPIFVFREHMRHRTQSYSEVSARYTPLPNLNYIPTVERLMMNSKTNKQAGRAAGSVEMTESAAVVFRNLLKENYAADQKLYERALGIGVPKELARVHLPVGRYSRMRATANLRNWIQFLTLRTAPNAQWEIRQYANAMCEIMESLFPRTMALFYEHGSL